MAIEEHWEKPKIGISSCLLGEKVRFDSGHKRNAYVTGILTDYFDFTPFCPEVEIGLGVPREPIRLVAVDGDVRCRGTKTPDLDVTDKLIAIANKQRFWHDELCGYILKKDSPSCGMARVKIYKNGMPEKSGIGLYARQLMQNFPFLPVEEEGRLGDMRLRENFIQRVFVYSRWKRFCRMQPSIAELQAFHARHKYILMSHNPEELKHLGSLLAQQNGDLQILMYQYLEGMMRILKVVATRKNHANTLQHIKGYLKKNLDASDKKELNDLIMAYKNGFVPLIVPVTLMNHHFRKNPNEYITRSYYMSPYPSELMLLNNI